MNVHTATRDIQLPDPINPNHRQGTTMTGNTERDELANLIVTAYHDLIEPSYPFLAIRETDREVADAILAAGYRKPWRVTSVEELDALPIDSVLKDRVGDIYGRVESAGHERPVWRVPGIRGYLVTASIRLPATVLYTPEVAL